MRVAGAPSDAEATAICDAAPGTTCGNHRAHFPRHLRASPGMVLAVQAHESARKAERNPDLIPPYKRGVRRFKSYCAHNFRILDSACHNVKPRSRRYTLPKWGKSGAVRCQGYGSAVQLNVDPVRGSAPYAGLGHDEYAWAVRIEPLPERLYDAAIRLWQDSGLTRPWNDPEADLRRAAGGSASCVLAAIGDDDGLLATAIVGHDGHRGWVYYLAVDAAQRGSGLGRQMMETCEDWVWSRGIPKIQLMVRATNRGTIGFYEHVGYADSEVVVLGRRLDG
jgi:ribosomal protein S18 acetylase RimI-like enzyme